MLLSEYISCKTNANVAVEERILVKYSSGIQPLPEIYHVLDTHVQANQDTENWKKRREVKIYNLNYVMDIYI